MVAGPVHAAEVITVPVFGSAPNTALKAVPHPAYNGHPTTLKAIARGLAPAEVAGARFRWDTDADGSFDDEVDEVLRQCVSGMHENVNCYDLGRRIVIPTQSRSRRFAFGIRLTVPGQTTVVATYPVHVYADVPAQTNPNSPTSASPQTATDRQLALMRAIARDDANGVVDRGVWRPGSGGWYVQGSATQWWGAPNDVPLNIAPAVRLKRFA